MCASIPTIIEPFDRDRAFEIINRSANGETATGMGRAWLTIGFPLSWMRRGETIDGACSRWRHERRTRARKAVEELIFAARHVQDSNPGFVPDDASGIAWCTLCFRVTGRNPDGTPVAGSYDRIMSRLEAAHESMMDEVGEPLRFKFYDEDPSLGE